MLGFIYLITFFLAGLSLLYELLIAQALSILSVNTVVRYSVTIGLYLLAMGAGALLCRKIGANKKNAQTLFYTELWLALVGALAIPCIYFAHMFYGFMFLYDNLFAGSLVFFLIAFAIVIKVGFLTGLELPLLIRIAREVAPGEKLANRILGADYLGSLAAALVFALVLVPRFELLGIGICAGLLNALAALAIIFIFLKKEPAYLRRVSQAGLVSIVLLGLLSAHLFIERYFLEKYYYYYESFQDLGAFFKPVRGLAPVERFNSPYQKIDIVHYQVSKDPFTPILVDAYSRKFARDPDYPRNYHLFLNGCFQLSSDQEYIYHEYFAHVPIILNRVTPRRILVLGAGDGMLTRELLKYPAVEKIVQVDIDRKIIELAQNHPVLKAMNDSSLKDPRVEIVIGDAYHYIRDHREKFDAVYMDFPDPHDYDLAKLYSREFYRILKTRLADDGFAVLDAPGINYFITGETPDSAQPDRRNKWPIYYHTLKSAGFGTIIPYISNLELDNPLARENLRKENIVFSLGPMGTRPMSAQMKEDFIRQMIKQYASDARTGFIFLKSATVPEAREYKAPPVPLDVLNEQRFYSAFALNFEFAPELDPGKINSVMRPRFPDFPFWFVLLPY